MSGSRLRPPSRFRQLIEAAPDAIVIIDSEGQIRYANAQAASLFGYPRARLCGEPVRMLLPDQPLPLPPSGGRGRRKPASLIRLELVASRRDSSQFPAAVDVILIHTQADSSAVVTIRDMTETQRARFVLERSMELFESADRDRNALLGYLFRAREEERRRIAAGIHDDTIQVITAAYLCLKQLRLQDPDQLEILERLGENLQLSLSRLRQLIFDLRPSSLENGNFVAALRTYLEQMAAETGIRYQLDDNLAVKTPVDRSVLIYRIAQEALMNVRKHARAQTVRVELLSVGEGCLVRIADDGAGYNSADVEDRPGHLGLTLMQEGAQLSGGWCRIESASGIGSTVEFWVPFSGPGTPAEPKP